MDVVWILVMFAGFGLLAWWAYRSDPHWVAKDGKAFTCRMQALGNHMLPDGRWRDARAFIDEQHLIVRPRRLFKSAALSGHYEVLKRAEDAPARYAIWLVDGGGTNGHEFAAVRIPAKSRAVAEIDRLVGTARDPYAAD